MSSSSTQSTEEFSSPNTVINISTPRRAPPPVPGAFISPAQSLRTNSTSASRLNEPFSQDLSHESPSNEPEPHVSPIEEDFLGENLLVDVDTSRYSSIRGRPESSISLVEAENSDVLRPSASEASIQSVNLGPSTGIIPVKGRSVISLDYGTTHTGVAFAHTDSNKINLNDIQVIQNWTSKINAVKIRSIISYGKSPYEWGPAISPDAVTMVNTKLELEPQDSRLDELDLTLHLLRGTGWLGFEHLKKLSKDPPYTWKSAALIITDYLKMIWKCAQEAIKINQLAVTKRPVDLVITVPVNWSYQSYDAIFKAVRNAGFNKQNIPTLADTILVTEPEAASYFTARELQTAGTDFLKPEEYFVLCDAGGGTVDTVSFQVKSLSPHLQLERATDPTGDKYGSSLIDTEFKTWLRDIIKEKYAEIDPANKGKQRISPNSRETGAMRNLISQFILRKERFSNLQKGDIQIDLPAPLDTLTIEGRVSQGQLTIHPNEMKKIMDTCVSGVITLIKKQIEKVEAKGRRVKTLLLVGGFGASPYLREELTRSMTRKKIKLYRPESEKSLTAVVQGGVIYGVEKARHNDVCYMSAVTESYGVLLDNGRFEWLVKKGDLVLSTQETKLVSRTFWHSAQTYVKGQTEVAIYKYRHDDMDLPENWRTSQHDVWKVGAAQVDLNGLVDRDLRPSARLTQVGEQPPFHPRNCIGPMRWDFTLSSRRLIAELRLKERVVGRCEIKIQIDPASEHERFADFWHDGDDE